MDEMFQNPLRIHIRRFATEKDGEEERRHKVAAPAERSAVLPAFRFSSSRNAVFRDQWAATAPAAEMMREAAEEVM